MDPTERPKRRPDIVLRALGSDAMLYDPVADAVVKLNRTSRRVWELCEGERDATAIAAVIANEFAVGPGQNVEADVRGTIGRFARAGLLH